MLVVVVIVVLVAVPLAPIVVDVLRGLHPMSRVIHSIHFLTIPQLLTAECDLLSATCKRRTVKMVARYGSPVYALIFVLVVVVVVVPVAVALVPLVGVVLRGLNPMSRVIHSTHFLTTPGPAEWAKRFNNTNKKKKRNQNNKETKKNLQKEEAA